jgi:hypothetical protein
MQSASSEHDVRHVVAPHTYGSHGRLIASMQTPEPLQTSATDSTPPVQLAGAHWVPLGWNAHAPMPSHAPV